MYLKLTELGKKFYEENDLTPATEGSAGIDLKYCGHSSGLDKLTNRNYWILHTGVCIWLANKGRVAQVVPRSSMSLKLLNTIGIIDSDYQGEILLRTYERNFDPGTRIAQLIVLRCIEPASFEIVDEFSEKTERGNKGLGSTGV